MTEPSPPTNDPVAPSGAAPPPPPPPSGGAWGPPGKIRSWLAVALLTLVTCGIYGIYWQYVVFEDNREHSGEGVGGPVALVFAILLGVVNLFLLPAEVGNIYAKAGQEKPVKGTTGFWVLIPIAGYFIWVNKVQTAINRRWEQMGVVPA